MATPELSSDAKSQPALQEELSRERIQTTHVPVAREPSPTTFSFSQYDQHSHFLLARQLSSWY